MPNPADVIGLWCPPEPPEIEVHDAVCLAASLLTRAAGQCVPDHVRLVLWCTADIVGRVAQDIPTALSTADTTEPF